MGPGVVVLACEKRITVQDTGGGGGAGRDCSSSKAVFGNTLSTSLQPPMVAG